MNSSTKTKTILKSFFVLSEFTPEEMKIKPHQVSEFNPNLLEQKQNNKSFLPTLLFSPISLSFMLCFYFFHTNKRSDVQEKNVSFSWAKTYLF